MGTLRSNDGYGEYSRPGLWQEKVPNCAFFATPLSAGDHTLKVARRGVPCRGVARASIVSHQRTCECSGAEERRSSEVALRCGIVSGNLIVRRSELGSPRATSAPALGSPPARSAPLRTGLAPCHTDSQQALARVHHPPAAAQSGRRR